MYVRGGEEGVQMLETPAEVNEELSYLLPTEHKGLHPELYVWCVVVNRVLTREAPSSHIPPPHALLEAKTNETHKLLRGR